jgi:hypothetical protein
MRIAFCGAAGTGKTTLTEWVSTEYGWPINPVGSRSVAKAMGFENPYDVDKAGKRAEFQERLITEKIAWEAAHERFVTDRTLIDNLTYTCLHDVSCVTEDFLNRTLEGFKRYDFVFFCPLDAFIKTGIDPARMHDLTYHRVFETLLLGWLLRVRNVRISVGPYDGLWNRELVQRKQRVREALGRKR